MHREGHEETEAEIGVTQPQAKEHPGLWSPQKLGGRHGTDSRSQREAILLTSWFWTPGLQNCEIIHFCCFKAPSLCIPVLGSCGIPLYQKIKNHPSLLKLVQVGFWKLSPKASQRTQEPAAKGLQLPQVLPWLGGWGG